MGRMAKKPKGEAGATQLHGRGQGGRAVLLVLDEG